MIGAILQERLMEMTIQRVVLVGSEKQPLKYKIKAWRVQIKVGSEFLALNLSYIKSQYG